MSRAIMLAGDRPHNREAVTKQAVAEKRVVGLESERNVLKQMLTTTQKERDELMKEVHRLHSHGICAKLKFCFDYYDCLLFRLIKLL